MDGLEKLAITGAVPDNQLNQKVPPPGYENTAHVRIEYTDGEGKKQVFEGDVKNRYKVVAEYLGNDVKIDDYVKDDPPK